MSWMLMLNQYKVFPLKRCLKFKRLAVLAILCGLTGCSYTQTGLSQGAGTPSSKIERNLEKEVEGQSSDNLVFPEQDQWLQELKAEGMIDIKDIEESNSIQVEFLRAYFTDAEIERMYFMENGEVIPISIDEMIEGLQEIVRGYESLDDPDGLYVNITYATNLVKWMISYENARSMREIMLALDKEYPEWQVLSDNPKVGENFEERVEYYSKIYAEKSMESYLLAGLEEYIKK